MCRSIWRRRYRPTPAWKWTCWPGGYPVQMRGRHKQNACTVLPPMFTYTCGRSGQHFYGKGDFCRCGQVPNHLLTAQRCNCGGSRLDTPIHTPDCRGVVWANERNAWVAEHPDTDPSGRKGYGHDPGRGPQLPASGHEAGIRFHPVDHGWPAVDRHPSDQPFADAEWCIAPPVHRGACASRGQQAFA